LYVLRDDIVLIATSAAALQQIVDRSVVKSLWVVQSPASCTTNKANA